mmetsp:Transcript_13490/g.24088  ORF Transcript_13490/g.24088 Transcript_13490/m.24088 type:complete len:273 (+) Transcript_13490:2632-3450(+)
MWPSVAAVERCGGPSSSSCLSPFCRRYRAAEACPAVATRCRMPGRPGGFKRAPALCSTFRTSTCPWEAATVTAVWPPGPVWWMSAFDSRSVTTLWTWPPEVAAVRQLRPSWVGMSISAPRLIRSRMQSVCPWTAAATSGVTPHWLGKFMSMPRSCSRYCSTWQWPSWAAMNARDRPLRVRHCGWAPAWTRARTTSKCPAVVAACTAVWPLTSTDLALALLASRSFTSARRPSRAAAMISGTSSSSSSSIFSVRTDGAWPTGTEAPRSSKIDT